jgi:hypothetical protein
MAMERTNTGIETGPNAPNPSLLQMPQHNAGTAIVLSGGGAKGDFEVGAVRCLYNNGIVPKILCGTSVGSVNALKLAEGETTPAKSTPPAGYVRGLAGLEHIWLGLETDQDMWQVEPGITAIFSTLANAPGEITTLLGEANQLQPDSIFGVVASVFGMPGFLSFAPQLSDLSTLKGNVTNLIGNLTSQLQDAENIEGLINYDPLEKLMRNGKTFFAPFQQGSGIALRLAMVALEDGALRYATETNMMIERDYKPTVVPPPVTAAQLAALKAKQAQLMDLVDSLSPSPAEPGGGPFQKPKPGLAGAKQQLARVTAQLNWQELPKDLIRAAIASSSLPVICRPTVMQDLRTYVDGGIRTLAPIQAAIDAGATDVYAIAAGSSKFDSQTMEQIVGGTPLPLLGIAQRVGEAILPDEVGSRDLFPANPWPVPVIVIRPDPSLDDIQDGLTIEPGLIRIRMAYGFMRAYDTLQAYKKFIPSFYQYATQQNSIAGKTMEIVSLRGDIWALEFTANGKQFNRGSVLPPAPHTVTDLKTGPDAAVHAQVKAKKAQLQTLINARIAHYADNGTHTGGEVSLPADFQTWSTQWEKHSWTPTIPL